MSIINLYRLGGEEQNRNLKPRLLLATLNSKDKQHEALANTWKLKGNQEWKKVYVDPDRTPEQRKEHNKLLEEMRAKRNNGEQVFLAQGKIKVRRQHFAREDNGQGCQLSRIWRDSHAFDLLLTQLTNLLTHLKEITRILTQFYKIENNLLFLIIVTLVRLSVTLFNVFLLQNHSL